MSVEWVDELPPRDGAGQGQSGVWFDRLEPVYERPGVWAKVHTVKSHSGAKSAVNNLIYGKVKRPDGFEFAARGDGVYARFVGTDDREGT